METAPRTRENLQAWASLTPEFRERCLIAWARALEERLAQVHPGYLQEIIKMAVKQSP